MSKVDVVHGTLASGEEVSDALLGRSQPAEGVDLSSVSLAP